MTARRPLPSSALVAILLAGLLAAPNATATDHVEMDHGAMPGPDLVPVAFHPFPDESDILGFPAPPADDRDHYMQAYRAYDLDRDGFDFPHVVVDGVTPIEGLPDASQPFASAKAAYAEAIRQRSTEDAPASIRIEARIEGDLQVEIRVTPTRELPGEDLRLRVVLIEDHVYFEAPPQLSNGITDHRFTARAIHSESIDLTTGSARNLAVTFPVASYHEDQLYVAAWLQQGPERGARFDPYEVPQAALHRVGTQATLQESKAVLLETYTASWCDACVYGDLAIEELAAEHGAGSPLKVSTGPTYWNGFNRPVLVVAGMISLATLLFVVRRKP